MSVVRGIGESISSQTSASWIACRSYRETTSHHLTLYFASESGPVPASAFDAIRGDQPPSRSRFATPVQTLLYWFCPEMGVSRREGRLSFAGRSGTPVANQRRPDRFL